MELIHPQVDIEPGRAGTRPPVPPYLPGYPLPDSAVLRLTNTTSRVNAYTIRVRSDHRYWQENWYTVVALPPAADRPENAPPGDKPDQRGPGYRSIKVFVPSGGTRDVMVRFNVPRRPDARAGKYPYQIVVETEVTGPGEGTRRQDRVTTLPAVAIVRPFYQWSIDLAPEQQRVGRLLRRRREFEVVVTNEGNDWLYCDLQVPKPREMLLETPTWRVAVPPAEPGELLPAEPGKDARPGTQRRLPLRAVTQLKAWRGDVMLYAVPLTAQRVDAPSVAPSLDDVASDGMGSVVASTTTEVQPIPSDRSLLYCPPIPSIRIGSIWALIGTLFLAAAVLLAIRVAYEHYRCRSPEMTINETGWTVLRAGKPLTMDDHDHKLRVGDQVTIEGKWLKGCELELEDKGNTSHVYSVRTRPDPKQPRDWHACQFTVPDYADGLQGVMRARRVLGPFAFLKPLLPASDPVSVEIGWVTVPDLSNISYKQAKRRAESIGGTDLQIIIANPNGEPKSEAIVIQQEPQPKASLRLGQPIRVTLQDTKQDLDELIDAPRLKGRLFQEAQREQKPNGVRLKKGESVSDPNSSPRDTILDQDPEPESPMTRREPITVTLSDGSKPLGPGEGGGPNGSTQKVALVPELHGLSPEQAKQAAQQAGLRIVWGPSAFSKEYPTRGSIAKQSLPKGSSVKRGRTIQLRLSKGLPPAPVVVPDLFGKTLSQAKHAASAVGFQIASRRPIHSPYRRDTIIQQEPGASKKFPKGTTVRVTLSAGPKPVPRQPHWRIVGVPKSGSGSGNHGHGPFGHTSGVTHAEVDKAGPLMVRALSDYLVVKDASNLRGRGWRYEDMATAGYLVRRSRPRRSLDDVVQSYEEKRDWAAVATQGNVALPGDPATVLRLALDNYPPIAGRVRPLEASGWTLEDILVAGNLNVRFSYSWDEIIRLRAQGLDWDTIAGRKQVSGVELYQPHSAR
jgi:beta-lactam-binding protein with PASTA domain